MLIIPPPTFRSGQRRPAKRAPVALSLVATTYSTAAWVRLTFDRPVNITEIDVTAIVVNDDDSDETYRGTGTATLVSAQEVQVSLAVFHSSTGPGTELTASGGTGIVAVDDKGTWAGVGALPLPFP